MESQLRLSLTLSGGASLGAYQSGATAAVLVAAQDRLAAGDDRVRVEAMGGASAGALVALFAAHALQNGIDPVALLRTLWVEKVSLDLLRSRHSRAPLDFEDMRNGLKEVLGLGDREPEHPPSRAPNPEPVALHVALTGLRGLTYPIRARDRPETVTGVTYTDWGQFTVESEAGPAFLFEPDDESPLDFVLASAANPGGFAPRRLDRSADADGYLARGIGGLPDHGRLWYSDGGLIQSEPLGRVTAAARALHGPGRDRRIRRVNVVVDPRSEGPSGSDRWADPDDVPRWDEGLSRALAILPAQVIYDDLRRMEKRNTRIQWAAELVERLRPHLDDDAGSALDEVLARIDEERKALAGSRAGDPDSGGVDSRSRTGDAGDDPVATRLRRAVDEIGGLVGKERVSVDVISPRLLTEGTDQDVPALLAGEFMGDFGGFLRYELRESDFRLGYESGRLWLERSLPEAGLDADTIDEIMDRVRSASPGDWREANRGRAELRSLPLRARLRLGRYVAHVARVLTARLLR